MVSIYQLNLRAHSLYSTVDGSRHGLFRLVGEKKIKNMICPHVHVGGKKKNKRIISRISFFYGGLCTFLPEKMSDRFSAVNRRI